MSKSKFKLIRGARVVQQMDKLGLLDEATYSELENRTMSFQPRTQKRQFAVDPQRVTSIELVAARESGNLQVNGVVQSDSGKVYYPQMLFENVVYEDSDQANNVTFKSATGDQHHIIPINLRQSQVKVRCTCLDFYYRFAVTNQQRQSLLGDGPPPYQKSQINPRGDVNPTNSPGLCKHLLALAINLHDARLIN